MDMRATMRRIGFWLRLLRGQTAPPRSKSSRPDFPQSGARRTGFAEGPAAALRVAEFADRPPPSAALEADGTDVATGPQGHRAHMRARLLDRGADGLADYEMLEMLLFFAFKQGDTKPLAKSLIGRFGSFAGVLAAPAATL